MLGTNDCSLQRSGWRPTADDLRTRLLQECIPSSECKSQSRRESRQRGPQQEPIFDKCSAKSPVAAPRSDLAIAQAQTRTMFSVTGNIHSFTY